MLNYWNIGDACKSYGYVSASASGIASILHCIFSRVRNVRFVLLSLFQSSIIPWDDSVPASRIALLLYTQQRDFATENSRLSHVATAMTWRSPPMLQGRKRTASANNDQTPDPQPPRKAEAPGYPRG